MNRYFVFITLIGMFFFISCGNKYKLELLSPKMIKIDKSFNLSVKEKNNLPIDSVQYFLNGKPLPSNENIEIKSVKLGKHAVSATVYYADKEKKLTNSIYFMAKNPPVIYTFEIINEYPHDKSAFTQGFEYKNGFLYESTGQYGQSSLRKVVLETGEVIQKIDIDKQYFTEGMTILNDKIYQLTWLKKKGFIYDLETFKLDKSFKYQQSKEGWGLTNNGKNLIKTDGTERMWFLDPETLKEEYFIETYTDKRKAEKLNELEFVNDKIYANIWQQNSMLIVNPESGAIEGIVDLKGLQKKAGQTGQDNVLNGIAYDKTNDRLFVTGKNWDKVFEIKLIEK
ncbi:MAG: glutaminyl-peptide cyclotransferase [Bacteroidota bacterium]